jgi:uncharacterized membrane protein YjjP (DUF1212 family)
MRLVRPVLRLGGWLVVVIAAIVGLMASFMAGNPNATEAAVAWIVCVVAFLMSGGMYWLLGRTAGETDDPGAMYQPTSVLGEVGVPS